MNARELRQLLPVLHAFAYRGVVEYKPLDGDTWTRINPDTTEFRPELMNPLEWRWTPTMPDDDEIMADYTEAELKSRLEELEKLATQRGKRIQIMREWMRHEWLSGYMYKTVWMAFIGKHPEEAGWFDADGVPVRNAREEKS